MPDLDQLFDGFSVEPASPPDGAREIRRRGDRLRRRTRVRNAVGVVAAVAVLATPVALLGGSDEKSAPPAPAGRELVRQVPDDFPLGAGLAAAELTETPGVPDLSGCGRTSDVTAGGVDVAGATSPRAARTLVLHGSDVQAERAFRDLRTELTTCPVDLDDEPALRIERVDAPVVTDIGASTAFVSTERDLGVGGGAGGSDEGAGFLPLEVLHLVQAGNVVLVARYTDPVAVDLDAAERSTQAVVDALDLFTAGLSPSTVGPAGPLLAASDLPLRDDLGAWAEVPTDDTLPAECVTEIPYAGRLLSTTSSRFEAPSVDGGTPGEVRVTILEYPQSFAGPAHAELAIDTSDCAGARDLTQVDLQRGLADEPAGQEGSMGTFVGPAQGTTGIRRHSAQALVLVDTQVLVLSFALDGGSDQPALFGDQGYELMSLAYDRLRRD